jgi:antitoxin (DNA-binding transcriptional repressor) of toxin-antitoxin stability system
MSTYSVADAKNHLPQLIDRALGGEPVVITRHGNPVVELRAIPPAPRPVTQADIDWLDSHRVGSTPAPLDAGTEVGRMRDEDTR